MGSSFSRRRLLQAGAGAYAGAALSSYAPLLNSARAAGLRVPDSLPDPTRAAGTPSDAMPFDHIVVVMQENHSFDNYLGMLPRRGQPAADAFTFDAAGKPLNYNPYKSGYINVQRATTLCQPGGPSQAWKGTHLDVNGGKMDGFATTSPNSMLYYDEQDLPFYYSLAKTFALNDRWFCSAPCQTYPNRRFMLAGTAFGLISTDTNSITEDPPNGTIFDRLNQHGVSWRNYFSDIPETAVIFSIPERNPLNLGTIAQFQLDCATGNLPAVSFVDSDIGVAGEVTSPVFGTIQAPFAQSLQNTIGAQNQDEENPSDISLGENFVANIVNGVLNSPAWPRILLLWVYDEHGGYFDHVPPPAAIPPDNIQPRLGPNDPKGGYDVYGPRVPAVVVSGYARPHTVTSVVHDHTSILATIEAKWNLPALTHRDANAATMMDFLDPSAPTFPEPPTLANPSAQTTSERNCSFDSPAFTIHPNPPPDLSQGTAAHLVAHFYGHGSRAKRPLVVLNTRSGALKGLTIELRRGSTLVAKAEVGHVSKARHRAPLHLRAGQHFTAGRYNLVVRQGAKTILRRRVRLG